MLCIYSSFLIQRRGLRLREEAMVLCFTEIELCFRDIYEKEKKEKEVLLHVWFIPAVTFWFRDVVSVWEEKLQFKSGFRVPQN